MSIQRLAGTQPPLNRSRAGRELSVRRATASDLDTIVPLFDAYRVFYGRSSNPGAARDFLSQRITRDESVVFVSELGQPAATGADVVGFAQLYRSFSSVSLGPVVVLNDLYVLPTARGLGAGGALIDAAASYARRSGALWLQLETYPDNEPAVRLYTAKGFVSVTGFAQLMLPLGNDGATISQEAWSTSS
jgi:ribosomal protein S18 acetylase RimI-like enzyme